MDWLHRLIEAAKAPAGAVAGVSGAGVCAIKHGFWAEMVDSLLDTSSIGRCRRLRRL